MNDFQDQILYPSKYSKCIVPTFETEHQIIAQNSSVMDNVTAFLIEFEQNTAWIRADQVVVVQ